MTERVRSVILKIWFSALFSQTGPDYGQGMNPISRLAQIQQAKKEKEPEYVLLSERGMPRRREFIMQVKNFVYFCAAFSVLQCLLNIGTESLFTALAGEQRTILSI